MLLKGVAGHFSLLQMSLFPLDPVLLCERAKENARVCEQKRDNRDRKRATGIQQENPMERKHMPSSH